MSGLRGLHAFFAPKVFEHDMFDLTELKTETINDKRHYITPTGNKYPSVTTFLGSFEDDDPEWFAKWAKSLGGVEFAEAESQRCCDRGEAVHKSLELMFLNKDLAECERVAARYAKMFKQLKTALGSKITKVHALEACLYSDILKIAGRVDCVAEYEGELAIVDFKTSTRMKDIKHILDYFLQCTLYSLMLEERTGLRAEKLVIAIAVENDPKPQIFIVKRSDYIPILMQKFIEFKGI